MKLIDIKDTLPVGFIPIQETVDTRESSFSTTHHNETFLPPGVFLDIFLCALFFGNILGVLTACPWINPAAFDACLTWFSKEFAVFWLVPCKWAECAFLLEWGSLLNRSRRNGRRSWWELVFSASSGAAEAKLGTRPRSKREKNQKTPREYKYNNVPIFSSWSSPEKPAREELQGRVHRIHCKRIHWALSRT